MFPRAASIVAATALVIVAWSTPPRPEQAWSTQLHVHGSFSEGLGSIDSHVFEAARLGVDVIWWSDHDFRITGSRSLTNFGFESTRIPYGPDEPWGALEPAWSERRRYRYTTRLVPSVERSIPGASAFTHQRACEGEKSLLVRGRSSLEEFEEHIVELDVSRALHVRPIAGDLVLRLSVLPRFVSFNATGMIELELSEHPDSEGEIRDHRVLFVLTNDEVEAHREGTTLVVPLSYLKGEWNHFELPVTRTVTEGFPELVGEDNSLHQVSFGIRSRRGALAEVYFDDLRFEQSLDVGDSYAAQRRVMAAVAARRPEVRQHQGVEESYLGPHLNEFSAGPELIDLDELFASAPDLDYEALDELYTLQAVEGAHSRGGLVSLNHFFGAGKAEHRDPDSVEQALERLVEKQLYGADLLEVGYRDRGGRSLAEHLWVWDRLPGRGLFPVGVGVSDSHGGPDGRWDSSPNNFVTWIWASSTECEELIEGLRAGRCFFGDIVGFDGTFDLATASGHRMGAVVVTGPEGEEIEVRVTGLEAGEVVHAVVDGVRRRSWPSEGPELTRSITIPRDGSATVIRAELTDADGELEVITNPIVLVESPPSNVDPVRLQ
jgi:hypothetical protein